MCTCTSGRREDCKRGCFHASVCFSASRECHAYTHSLSVSMHACKQGCTSDNIRACRFICALQRHNPLTNMSHQEYCAETRLDLDQTQHTPQTGNVVHSACVRVNVCECASKKRDENKLLLLMPSLSACARVRMCVWEASGGSASKTCCSCCCVCMCDSVRAYVCMCVNA